MFTDICNMHILIVAATRPEIQHTIDFFEEKKEDQQLKIQVAFTGVGLMSATYAISKLVSAHRPQLVIQAGIAGCFEANKNNTIVAIRKDTPADIGVCETDVFKTVFDLKLADENDFPFTNGELVNPYQKLLSIAGIGQANAITVNEITTDRKRIDWYQQKYNPFVESMEGAALHFVCLQEKISFLQLRSISNYIGERDKSKWSIKEAIGILNENLISLIKKLSTCHETDFRI